MYTTTPENITYTQTLSLLLVLNAILTFYFQAYSPKEATLAKVVPTPNNGFTELVKIHKEKVSYNTSGIKELRLLVSHFFFNSRTDTGLS